jgi:hypothetical protein
MRFEALMGTQIRASLFRNATPTQQHLSGYSYCTLGRQHYRTKVPCVFNEISGTTILVPIACGKYNSEIIQQGRDNLRGYPLVRQSQTYRGAQNE